MRLQQRLVVCLDGTWNSRDDSTNVFHHYALACEGLDNPANPKFYQRKFYHEGVGTSKLDRITGGAFGIGLEENVRDAYNWLVENYHGKDDTAEADEIYVFGFSRGAYSARSLVGLIACCGLLRRGAPLTVSQLWQTYCVLGRERMQRRNWAEKLFGRKEAQHRKICELVDDSWSTPSTAAPIPAEVDPRSLVAGQIAYDLNDSERLLVRWSRRVKITFLGVYDTVGAIGIDALALPGLTSTMAMHHNMQPSSIVQNCKHALAIEEHRAIFRHTPFLAHIPHAPVAGQTARQTRDAETRKWDARIEQRWFVGAHSNVGGGYSDNELAQDPFRWLFSEATKLGLVCEPLAAYGRITNPSPRDSYAEFGWFSTMVLRAKRYYRPICPELELRGANDGTSPGYSLYSVNESVDDSVISYSQSRPGWIPPNLVEYAQRALSQTPRAARPHSPLQSIAGANVSHTWLGNGVLPHLALVLWASFAAAGVLAVNDLTHASHDNEPAIWVLFLIAFAFALTDWLESLVNHIIARGSWRPMPLTLRSAAGPANSQLLGRSYGRWQAIRDSLFWGRALGVVLAILGVFYVLVHSCEFGWVDIADLWGNVRKAFATYWHVPVGAALGAVAAPAIGAVTDVHPLNMPSILKGVFVKTRPALLGAALGFLASCLIILAVMCCSWGLRTLLPPANHLSQQPSRPFAVWHAQTAGLLILLEIAGLYFAKALVWVGEPSEVAGIDSVTKLQFRFSPATVESQLTRSREALNWDPGSKAATGHATKAMVEVYRTALWRDMLGFVPLYFTVLTFGLWYASRYLNSRYLICGGYRWLLFDWLNNGTSFLALWCAIPLAAAAADWAENACHLQYLKLFGKDRRPSPFLVGLASLMTFAKFAAFAVAGTFTLAAILCGIGLVSSLNATAGWRGSVALGVSLIALTAALTKVASEYSYWRRNARPRKPDSNSLA